MCFSLALLTALEPPLERFRARLHGGQRVPRLRVGSLRFRELVSRSLVGNLARLETAAFSVARRKLLIDASPPQLLLLLDRSCDTASSLLLRSPPLKPQLQHRVLVRLLLALLCGRDFLCRLTQHSLHAGVSLLVRQVHALVRSARGR